MRILGFFLISLAVIGGGAAAHADEDSQFQLPYEFRIVNADKDIVAEGYGTLEWNGCGGDLFAFTGEKVDEATAQLTDGIKTEHSGMGWLMFGGGGLPYGQPMHVAFYAGNADLGLLEDEVYRWLFCNPCCVSSCPIEPSWANSDDCWYLYETSLCLPDGIVYARAWMPVGMVLELSAWQEPSELPGS